MSGRKSPLQLPPRTPTRILEALLRYGPISQRGLAHCTRLHQATVSRALSELKRHGLAVESADRTPLRGSRGRRPAMVDLDPQRAVVLGVHIGLNRAALGLIDLRGGVLARSFVPNCPEPASRLGAVIESARSLLREVLPPRSHLLGVGVGTGGAVDSRGESVRFRPNDKRGLRVKERLARAFAVPVYLSSNVHAMALAEAWFGVGNSADSVALLYVSSVIRLALVVEGRVYQGSGPRDEMFGHIVLDPDGPPCICGQHGCLEVLASDGRLRAEALRLAQALPQSGLGRRIAAPGSDILSAVVAAAGDGDSRADSLLRSRARWLAQAIVIAHHTLNPSRVLLTGTPQLFDRAGLERIQLEVARLAPQLAGPAGVGSSTIPFPDIAIVGAATLVLEAIFSEEGRGPAVRRSPVMRSGQAPGGLAALA